jgi:transcriptional regulator with XRE-family HTH domain
MEEPQTWRDLLAKIINSPQDKQRLTEALGVSPVTLTRWAQGKVTPRSHYLHRLLESVPHDRALLATLLAKEFDDFAPAPVDDASASIIPVTFYAHALDLSTTVPEAQRFWSLCTAVLQEALSQLDPNGLGARISVVQCMAPFYGTTVRCLRERISLGTPPWSEQVEREIRFLGAESLAGHAVSSCHLQTMAHLDSEQRLLYQLPEHTRSAAATPILYTGRIAGCLLVTSAQPNSFLSSAQLGLIESYAALLSLAFHPEDFYEHERITLRVMPSFQVQQSYLSTLRQRILALLRKAMADQQPLSYQQAEEHAWRQVEEELLQR